MVKAVPDGYHTLTPYLTVPDPERILRFLQDVWSKARGTVQSPGWHAETW